MHRTIAGLIATVVAALLMSCSGPTPTPTVPADTPTPTQVLSRIGPTPTPTVPTATPEPTATPVPEPTPTPTPEPTSTPTPGPGLDHPAALLSLLPMDIAQFIFVEAGLVLQRPALREEVEHGIEILDQRTAGVLSMELLALAGIKSAAFGITDEYLGAAILLGDFEPFPGLLQQAPSLADTDSRFDPPGPLGQHRGVELYIFPWYDDLFVAVPDSGTLLLAQSAGLLKEIIDRYLDGRELSESLADLLTRIEPIDFLIARRIETGNANRDGQPMPVPSFHAHAGFLNEGETCTIYAYMEFDEFAQAEQARDWLAQQEDLSGLFFGYNRDTGKPVGEVRQDGRAIIAEAVVPDKDVPDLFSGN